MGSMYLNAGWYNFEGFAVVLQGEQGERIELVPSGVLHFDPITQPGNILALTVRVAVGNFSGEVTSKTALAALYELLDDLDEWDPDGNAGFSWSPGQWASIQVQHAASVQGWNLHFQVADRGTSIRGNFPLDRGCIVPARSELAAVMRCLHTVQP